MAFGGGRGRGAEVRKWRVEDGGWKRGVLDITPALGLWLRGSVALPAVSAAVSPVSARSKEVKIEVD